MTERDELEELLFRCLESEDPEAYCRRVAPSSPEDAARLRRLLRRLEDEEMLAVGAGAGGLPERLGGFRLVRRLGAGGMGEVHLAEQEEPARQVALKIVRADLCPGPAARLRFRREAAAVARLQHPGIVQVYASGEDRGIPWYAMELVRGASLAEVVADLGGRGPADVDGGDLDRVVAARAGAGETPGAGRFRGRSWVAVVVDLGVQLADALQHAHERGVLHRDVKPSNVLVTPDGRVRLVDFGLAQAEGDPRLTRSTHRLGSLPYSPPEVLEGPAPVPSPSLDVYALGVTLYELLALRHPFVAGSEQALRGRILDGRVPPLRSLQPEAGRDLDTVVATALHVDPIRRYARIGDLGRDLERVRRGEPVRARRSGVFERVSRRVRRRPALAAALAVAAVSVLASPLVLWQQERRAREAIAREARVAEETVRFLESMLHAASPDESLGREVPIRTVLEEGTRRIDEGLRDQPVVRARLLATIGSVHRSLGSHPRAEAMLRHAVEWAREALPDSGALRRLHWEHARVLAALRRHREALATIDDLLARGPEGSWPRSGHLLLLRSARASALRHLARLEEAERVRRGVVADARAADGTAEDRGRLAHVLVRAAGDLLALRREQEARPLFEEAIELRREVYGGDSTVCLEARISLARCLSQSGEHEQALALLDRVEEATRRIYGADHPSYAVLLGHRGHAHRQAGELAAAAGDLAASLAIRRRITGTGGAAALAMANELAKVHLARGRPREALEALDPAVAALGREVRGDEWTIDALMTHADCSMACGDTARAEASLQRAEDLLAGIEASPDLRLDAALTRVWLALSAGRVDEAASLAEEAAVVERLAGREDPSAVVLRCRAINYRAMIANFRGDGARAEELLRPAIAEIAAHFPRHELLAYAWNGVGWARTLQGRDDEAVAAFRRSIAAFDALRPEGHVDAAWPLRSLAAIVLDDDPVAAGELLQRAVAVRRQGLPPDSPLTWSTELELAAAWQRAGRPLRAVEVLAVARERARTRLGEERHRRTLEQLVRAELDADRGAAALDHARRLLEVCGDEGPRAARARVLVGEALLAAGRPGAARRELEGARSELSEEDDLHDRIAELIERAGDG